MLELQRFLAQLGEGMWTTTWVFVITLVLSLPLSIPLAMMRISKNKLFSALSAAFIYVMRGTPLMLQLMFVYFGLPLIPVLPLVVSREVAIVIAFSLNYAAYFAEIFRGGIQSISKGQWEAGKVLGLSKQFTFQKIIVPQVIKTTLPSLANEVITLVKDTSLVYVLGAMDVMKVAKGVSNSTASFLPFLFAGIVYLIIVFVLTQVLKALEKRYLYYN